MSKAAITFGVAAALALLWVGTGTAKMKPTPAQKCQSGMNVAAGKYADCRQKAEAKLVATGDTIKHDAAILRCETKFSEKWDKLIQKATAKGATCPDWPLTGLQFKTVIDEHTGNMTTALGGGGLEDNRKCASDLALCLAEGLPEARVLRTGQTGCYDNLGPIECDGSGQDGELQKGVGRSYTDNGNGTITNNQSGLMWEAKSQDGSIHDWRGVYTWDQAFSLFISGLNTSPCFAGHCDWRLPNLNELQSLVDYGRLYPAIDPKFNANCAADGCTVDGVGGTEKCSCTIYNGNGYAYWSSTSAVWANPPGWAWYVDFSYGGLSWAPKYDGTAVAVRAVRGGS